MKEIRHEILEVLRNIPHHGATLETEESRFIILKADIQKSALHEKRWYLEVILLPSLEKEQEKPPFAKIFATRNMDFDESTGQVYVELLDQPKYIKVHPIRHWKNQQAFDEWQEKQRNDEKIKEAFSLLKMENSAAIDRLEIN